MSESNSHSRITFDMEHQQGRPCIRGMQLRVSTILEELAAGETFDQVLERHPELEAEDLRQALRFAAWLAEKPVVMMDGM